MIHLAVSFDKNYLTPFYALLASVFESNPKQEFSFHCITKDIIDNEKQKLQDYLHQNACKVHYYEINEQLLENLNHTTRGLWTLATYYKVFFPFLVPVTIEKLLYLDIDMIVLKPLKSIYDTPIDGYPVGAVCDRYTDNRESLGIFSADGYFNAGLLLFNIPVWKEQNITEKTLDFASEYPEKLKFVDQDALNAVLVDNWKKLSENYNLVSLHIPFGISKKEADILIKDKVVIHFTGKKPWHFLCSNRYRYLYTYYLRKSPKKHKKIIIDFAYSKIWDYIKIRFVEFYLDNPLVHKAWKLLKKAIKNSKRTLHKK
jgi:lipopolysaccharide biosynthesis glycosyltransferase